MLVLFETMFEPGEMLNVDTGGIVGDDFSKVLDSVVRNEYIVKRDNDNEVKVGQRLGMWTAFTIYRFWM